MSTTFYFLRPPITAVRVVNDAPNITYLTVNIFVAHQLSGSLQLNRDELQQFVELARGIELVHRTARENGPKYETINAIPDDAVQVVSEYGDLIDADDFRREVDAAIDAAMESEK